MIGKNTFHKIGRYFRYIMPSRKAKVLYIGWLGHKNWGDEALFYVISNKLKGEVQLIPSESFHKILYNFGFKIDFKSIFLGGGHL